jgi:hypothetical protein
VTADSGDHRLGTVLVRVMRRVIEFDQLAKMRKKMV